MIQRMDYYGDWATKVRATSADHLQNLLVGPSQIIAFGSMLDYHRLLLHGSGVVTYLATLHKARCLSSLRFECGVQVTADAPTSSRLHIGSRRIRHFVSESCITR